MRRHFKVPLPRLSPNPVTNQTSPFQVDTAARLPSLKKSNPERRIQEFQGVTFGVTISSTT